MAGDLVELIHQAITTTDLGLRVSPEALRRLLRENRETVLRELGGEQVGKTTAFFEPADDMWLFPVAVCASCGSPDIVNEGPAEGYWCRGCGASDGDG